MELTQVLGADVLHVVLTVLSHEMEAAEADGEYTPAARPAKASKTTLLIFIVTSFRECPRPHSNWVQRRQPAIALSNARAAVVSAFAQAQVRANFDVNDSKRRRLAQFNTQVAWWIAQLRNMNLV